MKHKIHIKYVASALADTMLLRGMMKDSIVNAGLLHRNYDYLCRSGCLASVLLAVAQRVFSKGSEWMLFLRRVTVTMLCVPRRPGDLFCLHCKQFKILE